VFHADWDQFGKRAGYLRNEQMLNQHPTAVWAFWDGQSRGTLHTMREARKRKLPMACWVVDPASGVARMVRDRIPTV
jgi:ABC-type sugar transport system substrate-binding protein